MTYENDTTGETLSHRALQDRLGASFPRDRPPEGWSVKALPAPTLDDLKQRKRAEIESALAEALRAGMPYTMPDGTPEVIQTRPGDEPNLLGLAMEARDLRAAGEINPVMLLRVQSNINYQLTPDQMIAVTNAASAHKKQALAKSWNLKKQARDATTEAELDTITW